MVENKEINQTNNYFTPQPPGSTGETSALKNTTMNSTSNQTNSLFANDNKQSSSNVIPPP